MLKKLITTTIVFCITTALASAKLYSNVSATSFLNFEEIKSILSNIKPKSHEVNKLGDLMNTVFSSPAQEMQRVPLAFDKSRYKNYLRVSQWNLESVDIDDFHNKLSSFNTREEGIFNSSDIIALNSVGFHNETAKFQNIAELFAEAFAGIYVFAPEFLEASPKLLKERKFFGDFRGLSGNAIIRQT